MVEGDMMIVMVVVMDRMMAIMNIIITCLFTDFVFFFDQ